MSRDLSQTIQLKDWARVSLALLIALGVHGIWFSMEMKPVEDPQELSFPHLVAYTKQTTGGWSPTLFSLPSVTGFSGAMRDNRLESAPPLRSPLNLTEKITLQRSARDVELPSIDVQEDDMQASVFRNLPSAPQEELSAPGWLIDFPDAAGLEIQWSRLPGDAPELSAFELTGDVQFDLSGRVQSLQIHPPIPEDPVTQEAIHTLRRMRCLREPPPSRVRFRFSYRTSERASP